MQADLRGHCGAPHLITCATPARKQHKRNWCISPNNTLHLEGSDERQIMQALHMSAISLRAAGLQVATTTTTQAQCNYECMLAFRHTDTKLTEPPSPDNTKATGAAALTDV